VEVAILMRIFPLWLALALLLLSSTGCPGDGQLAGISDSTFVDVMARLHQIETDERLSREERDSLRQLTLQEEDLSPERLEEAARSLAREPERALAIWQAIERKSGVEPHF
jgi:hypothetical protein